MSTALAITKETIPAYILARAAQAAADNEAALAGVSTGGVPRIKMNGTMFSLVNAEGESTFVRFQWRPKLGLQATTWNEAVKLAGADPDFHRAGLDLKIRVAHSGQGAGG